MGAVKEVDVFLEVDLDAPLCRFALLLVCQEDFVDVCLLPCLIIRVLKAAVDALIFVVTSLY